MHKTDLKIPILMGFAVALLCVNVYVCTELGGLMSRLGRVEAYVDSVHKKTETQISNLRDHSALLSKSANKGLTALQQELEETRRQIKNDNGADKSEAILHAEALARRIAVEQQNQERAGQRLQDELQHLKGETTTATSKIEQVSKEVGSVRSEIALSRSNLLKTVSDLKRVNGELGVQSGLVATNRKELEALRALGERNYHDFTITRRNDFTRVADVMVNLKRADSKHRRFTVEVIIGDQHLEKRDRTVDEPIQFFVSKTRPPYEVKVNDLYELVVMDVSKDRVTGYLSVPKIPGPAAPEGTQTSALSGLPQSN